MTRGDELRSPPPERGRSSGEAQSAKSGGWGSASNSKFSRTPAKTAKARKLRREMTDAEKRLWLDLRGAQMHAASFRRQHPIGRYVLDFYCPQLKLAIELDGDQHGWEAQAKADAQRDAWLKERGVTTLRFANVEYLRNRASVLETIHNAIGSLARTKTPTPTLPLAGGGSHENR